MLRNCLRFSEASLLVFIQIVFIFPYLFFSIPTAFSIQTVGSENLPEIRVCSQNLFRYGDDTPTKRSKAKKQREYLLLRFKRANCDVIAVQEVFGESKKHALRTLDDLAKGLKEETGRDFQSFVGDSFDPYIRNGFLVADDIGKLQGVESFSRELLPRLRSRGPGAHFVRAPLGLRLVAYRQGEKDTKGSGKQFFILNLHFKSKHQGWKDPSGTQFETLRMQMAEGVRRIALREAERLGPDTVLVVLGDRNSDSQSATAQILSGSLMLEDFKRQGKRQGNCRLDDDLAPQCKTQAERSPELLGLFAYREKRFPGQYPGGSYSYKRQEELIDEIFIKPETFPLVRLANSSPNIGMEGHFYRGSDHKLAWVEFNW